MGGGGVEGGEGGCSVVTMTLREHLCAQHKQLSFQFSVNKSARAKPVHTHCTCRWPEWCSPFWAKERKGKKNQKTTTTRKDLQVGITLAEQHSHSIYIVGSWLPFETLNLATRANNSLATIMLPPCSNVPWGLTWTFNMYMQSVKVTYVGTCIHTYTYTNTSN